MQVGTGVLTGIPSVSIIQGKKNISENQDDLFMLQKKKFKNVSIISFRTTSGSFLNGHTSLAEATQQ